MVFSLSNSFGNRTIMRRRYIDVFEPGLCDDPRRFEQSSRPFPLMLAFAPLPFHQPRHRSEALVRKQAGAMAASDQLNLATGLKADVKDLWSKKVTKGVRGSHVGTVAAHGVLMVRITPVP